MSDLPGGCAAVENDSLETSCSCRKRIRVCAFGLLARSLMALKSGSQMHRDEMWGRLQHIDALARELDAVSPQAVLRRGYTMTTRKKDGLPLRSAAQVKPGDKLVTRFADGEVASVVEDSKQLSLFE